MLGSGRSPEDGNVVEQVLGYLNFSSGAEDPRFLANLNRVFELDRRRRPQRAGLARRLAGAGDGTRQAGVDLGRVSRRGPGGERPAAGSRPRRPRLFRVPPRSAVPPVRGDAGQCVFLGPGLRSGAEARAAVGRGGTHHRGGDRRIERLPGPSAGGGAGIPEDRAVPARMGAARAPVHSRRRRRRRTVPASGRGDAGLCCAKRTPTCCEKPSSTRSCWTNWPSTRGPTISIIRRTSGRTIISDSGTRITSTTAACIGGT